MKSITLASPLITALALLLAHSAFAALNPDAPNPYPTRASQLLVGFEGTTNVTSDPNGAGENRASINTDPQFVAEGARSLKLDLNGVGGYHDYFVVPFPAPIDIQGYQVLSMDAYVPLTSLNDSDPSGGWFQFDPRPTTTLPGDDTRTVDTQYGPVNMHDGWNHLIWVLKNGTDTKLTKLTFAGNTNSDKPFTGPVYVDNIRIYKGNFVGLQPDEKLIFGFDNTTDANLFDSLDGAAITVNTDKQFISQGTGSLEVDLTGQGGGWSNTVARAADWGTTIDASRATALHLDVFVPEGSYPTAEWHELAFGVSGEGGDINPLGGTTGGVENVSGQWITLEIPLTPDQAQMLTNVGGMWLLRNSGNAWTGPIYIDNLRAVIPAP